ncbi:MAG: hypothetical protein KGI70_00130 [Patescibacteria group bacterium]|nr:hypothetical protein [Patescibacteria group bacterium]
MDEGDVNIPEDTDMVSMPERGVRHYYGDIVRWLFVAAALVMIVALPVYPDLIAYPVSLQLAWAVVLIVFAALTSPRRAWPSFGDAILAVLGLVLFETIAISAYEGSAWVPFMLREGFAVLYALALYFSIKTVRARVMGRS